MPDWSYLNHYMPQSQYYEQDWNNHHYSSQNQWGYNSPELYCQLPYQHLASYNPSPERRIKWLGKEDGSLRRAWATYSNFRRLIIPSKFSNHSSLLYFLRRTCWLRKEYGIYDSISKWLSSILWIMRWLPPK